MSFLRFVFSFLYIRNWHNGQMELSKPRVMLFAASVFLFVLAAILIGILQAPVEYTAL